MNVDRAWRNYRRGYRAMERQLDTGGAYGWDWRTLALVSPTWARTLRRLLAAVSAAERANTVYTPRGVDHFQDFHSEETKR